MLQIEFWVGGGGVLVDIYNELMNVQQLVCENALPVDESHWIAVITAEGLASGSDLHKPLKSFDPADILYTHPQVDNHYIIRVRDSLSVLLIATAIDVIPHRLIAKNGGVRGIATARDWGHLKEFADRIEDQYKTFDLLKTTQSDGVGYPLGNARLQYVLQGKLSETQIETLQTAWRSGYFAVPQQTTAEDLATKLNISPSTLSERLRRAQAALYTLLFDGEANN